MKMSLLSPPKVKEIQAIKEVRILLGLPAIKMGFKNCFKCDKQFFSEDLCRERSCYNCRSNPDSVV